MNDVKTGWPKLDGHLSYGPVKNYLVQSQASDAMMGVDFALSGLVVKAEESFHLPDLTYSKNPTSLDPIEDPADYLACVPDPEEEEVEEVAALPVVPISAIDELEAAVLTEKLTEIQYLPPTDAMIAKYMQRRCAELQIKQHKLHWYSQEEDPLQLIATALDKAEFSAVDLMYACSLIRSFATLARNAKNDLNALVNDACPKEVALNTLKALAESMESADRFAKNMHEEGAGWRKKVWLKTRDGRTTICQTQPKKVWDTPTQVWKYPLDVSVEQVWMVKRVESGTW